MTECLLRSQLIHRAQAQGLESELSRVKSEIDRLFHATTSFSHSCEQYVTPPTGTFPPGNKLIPSAVRIAEVSFAEMNAIKGPTEGLYLHKYGKILIVRGGWCLGPLVHETFHSLSSFNTDSRTKRKLLFLYEGLTELLTGYYLREKYPRCYSECWPKPSARPCEVDYVDSVKLWKAIFHFVPLRWGTELYFHRVGSVLVDHLRTFHRRIRSKFPSFRDILLAAADGSSSIDSFTALLEECETQIGKRFKQVFEGLPTDLAGLTLELE